MTDQETISGISRRRKNARSQGGAEYRARRAELIRAASAVFRDKGYEAATLNDVAEKVGTDRASVYYYVGSKQELFEECITGVVVANLEKAKAIVATEATPRDKLVSLIDLLIRSQAANYPQAYLYMQEDIERSASQGARWATAMRDHTHQMESIFIGVLRDGVADGSFRSDLSVTLMANSLFGMTQWTHRWWVPGESRYQPDDLVKVFTTVLTEGIAAPR